MLYNRNNLYTTLSTYSLDNGPLPKDDEGAPAVTFRFMQRDWNNTLRDLLERHNVPVVKENVVKAEKQSVWH